MFYLSSNQLDINRTDIEFLIETAMDETTWTHGILGCLNHQHCTLTACLPCVTTLIVRFRLGKKGLAVVGSLLLLVIYPAYTFAFLLILSLAPSGSDEVEASSAFTNFILISFSFCFFLSACFLWMIYIFRRELRQKYKIEGSLREDILYTLLLPCCSLCQMYDQVESQKDVISMHGQANSTV